MPFTAKRQNVTGAYSGSGNTLSVTMPSGNPIQGNLVVFGITGDSGIVIASVADGNNNLLAVTPHSPSATFPSAGSVWIYWYVAGATANQTFTVTFTVNPISTFCGVDALEFTVTGTGTPRFDTDIIGNGTTGATINTPTITPSGAGELLYAIAAPENSISAQGAPWDAGVAPLPGIAGGDEWILSSTGSPVAVAMTQVSGHWDSIAAAFTQAPPFFNVAGDDSQQITVIQQADNVISIW